jgi:tRNA(Ile)-lysidine synthase
MTRVWDAFDRRLERDSDRPIAVAVSGGADSLLALIETAAWARDHGRTVIALSINHALQAMSAEWTAQAGAVAQRLGCGFRALRWDGDKPRHGLPAAARLARHRLLADAARTAGARVIVTGHTGDDALENAATGLGPLYEWSASPVWPQGRGLCLLRPLLSLRRRVVRETLTAVGWTWVDDPANGNLAHPRIAARQRMLASAELPVPPGLAQTAGLARTAMATGEAIRLPRTAFRDAGPTARRRVTAAAAVSLGGGDKPVRGERLEGLVARLAGFETFVATLAGAQITADDRDILFVRNAGEQARGGLAAVSLPGVWDGRYEVTGDGELMALRGQARRLPDDQRRALAQFPAQVRPSLPVIVQNGAVDCPLLARCGQNAVKALVPGRFLTACGVYAHERELM